MPLNLRGPVPPPPAGAEEVECPSCGAVAYWEGRMYVCIDCEHEFFPPGITCNPT